MGDEWFVQEHTMSPARQAGALLQLTGIHHCLEPRLLKRLVGMHNCCYHVYKGKKLCLGMVAASPSKGKTQTG